LLAGKDDYDKENNEDYNNKDKEETCSYFSNRRSMDYWV
jgi:hypothetical protein